MGRTVEAGTERVLDHLRGPVPGRGDLLTDDAGNTVSETVPLGRHRARPSCGGRVEGSIRYPFVFPAKVMV